MDVARVGRPNREVLLGKHAEVSKQQRGGIVSLPSEYGGFANIVGRSKALRAAVQRAAALASVDMPVLVQGETGVGKEIFARAIHQNGCHASGPFVAVNCGGLPREILASELFGYVDGAFTGARRSGGIGKLEAADGGTLFLDEIAEMPLELQPYLLRVLEGGEIYPLGTHSPRRARFRLIAATNRDLLGQVTAARFRMDLYYRISVTTLHVPPLRERTEDLPDLVEHFAFEVAERNGLAAKHFLPEAISALTRHSWPGNVRELRNVVEAMVLLAGPNEVVGTDALPRELSLDGRRDSQRISTPPSAGGLKELEREAIASSIKEQAGNLTEVAKVLHVSRSTLYLKLRRYGLEPMLAEVRRRSRHREACDPEGDGLAR